MADPKEHYYLVHTYPDGKLSGRLIAWITSTGVDPKQVHFFLCQDRNVDCAYNSAIKLALASDCDYFVFADNDIGPRNMEPFWEAKADIVGVKYDTGQGSSWSEPNIIHAALWRTHRRALEHMGAPWFRHLYNEDRTATLSCVCVPFSLKAQSKGLSLAVAGTADHTPRRPHGKV
ncbi:unnamed protein product [marine sediment metagenome]|uniref:Glycosyltransferase 2-like domain-containing protein n=1 Tax=marine sediment metagenome TaxID=412755 RepID=X0TXU8_9ZZZZ